MSKNNILWCVKPRHLISDAHEWINEIPTVPIYYLAKPQPRERAWQKQQGKKTLLSLTLVHNTNDMTLVHLNECFNGKFNDDHCKVQNYLYCFSCKTVTSVHNNNNCKTITPVHNNRKKRKFNM